MSFFEKLYNLASKPLVFRFSVVMIVLEILFITISSGGFFSEISNHPLFRVFLILLLLILLFGIYTVIVHSYLNQEKKTGTTPTYKKFKKKFAGILVWMLLIGISSTTFAKYTITDTKSAKINKCISNYEVSKENCNQYYSIGKNSQTTILTESEGRQAFVNSCLKNTSNENYCNCGFDKIVDKYSYEGYFKLKRDFAESVYKGKSTVELKEFWKFIQNIPVLCSINNN